MQDQYTCEGIQTQALDEQTKAEKSCRLLAHGSDTERGDVLVSRGSRYKLGSRSACHLTAYENSALTPERNVDEVGLQVRDAASQNFTHTT